MDIKFNKLLISSINNSHSTNLNKNSALGNSRNNAVPSKETFYYILQNAKNGNEMAAVQLDEWHKSCVPQNNREKQIIRLIDHAVNEILK